MQPSTLGLLGHGATSILDYILRAQSSEDKPLMYYVQL